MLLEHDFIDNFRMFLPAKVFYAYTTVKWPRKVQVKISFLGSEFLLPEMLLAKLRDQLLGSF